MLDIKWIRENPEQFDSALKKRGLAASSANLIALDEARRTALSEMQTLQQRRNAIAKEIGIAKKNGLDASQLMQEAEEVNQRIKDIEEKKEAEKALENALLQIPNLPDDSVPLGGGEDENVEIKKVGEVKSYPFAVKEHGELGENLGMISFEKAAAISGARFTFLTSSIAKLERALGNFMLDIHSSEFGYTEVSPPLLVKDNALFGTGQLPKFSEDLFKTNGEHWLIPTAEVSLTNLVREQIINEEELPLRFTAWTQCFRLEAGSAGRDTKGMIRQHQFSKVELVSITSPEQSKSEHERMLSAAEEILKRLELPYRVMLLCSGDMGFSATKTYDIEVWLPSQNKYREISSCSNCGDFQARRMKARTRKTGDKETRFVHTLNGSGLAVGRTLVAILENYQNSDGTIQIPDALIPYMGGLKAIV